MRARILLFAKAPLPGRAKTRLIPALGPEGAAALARQMLARAAAEAQAAGLGVPELCGDPDPAGPAWRGLLPPGPLRLSAQGEGDLGARMARAAARVLGGGENAVLIGADCPGLTASRIAAAAAALARADAFLHPAEDGGYVLLALRRFHPGLFGDMPWGGPEVAARTAARIRALGWTLEAGETLRDVDEPADLERR